MAVYVYQSSAAATLHGSLIDRPCTLVMWMTDNMSTATDGRSRTLFEFCSVSTNVGLWSRPKTNHHGSSPVMGNCEIRD